MEARQTLRGSAVPKGLTVVLALCAAASLAVGAAVVSNQLKGSSASQTTSVHAAPGTVLRQDAQAAPALIDRGAEGQAASQASPVLARGGRTGGNQSIQDGPAAPAIDAEPNYGLTHGNRYI
jgi:hypothetical protein